MKKRYFLIMIIFISFISSFVVLSFSNSPKEEKREDTNKSLVSSTTQTNDTIDTNEIIKLQKDNNNSDISAILSIENSTFSEIVVQTKDNDYYLTHNYKKESDKLGAIYADYRINLDTSKKNLIYGHSSTKKDTPFNYLEKYYDEDFYKEHKYLTLTTKNNTYKYEIFSVYVETSDFTYMNLKFNKASDWYQHILKLQKKSLYETNITLTNKDKILILQTCSTNPKYKKYQKKYLLIVSRRVN